jgi:hypothetical protein
LTGVDEAHSQVGDLAATVPEIRGALQEAGED